MQHLAPKPRFTRNSTLPFFSNLNFEYIVNCSAYPAKCFSLGAAADAAEIRSGQNQDMFIPLRSQAQAYMCKGVPPKEIRQHQAGS